MANELRFRADALREMMSFAAKEGAGHFTLTERLGGGGEEFEQLSRAYAYNLSAMAGGIDGAMGLAMARAAHGLQQSRNVATNTGRIGDRAAERVTWVDENTGVVGRARNYDDSAMGARSNVETQRRQAPALTRTLEDGSTATVRFDGVDGDVLVDRKISVVTTTKARDQAVRQSAALAENGLTGRWEVPTQTQANRANRVFEELGIENITVRVVPE